MALTPTAALQPSACRSAGLAVRGGDGGALLGLDETAPPPGWSTTSSTTSRPIVGLTDATTLADVTMPMAEGTDSDNAIVYSALLWATT